MRNGTRGLEVNPERSVLLSIPGEGEMNKAMVFTTVEIKMRLRGGTIPEDEEVLIQLQPLNLDEDGQLELVGHNRYSNHPLTDGLVWAVSLKLDKAKLTQDGEVFQVRMKEKEEE